MQDLNLNQKIILDKCRKISNMNDSKYILKNIKSLEIFIKGEEKWVPADKEIRKNSYYQYEKAIESLNEEYNQNVFTIELEDEEDYFFKVKFYDWEFLNMHTGYENSIKFQEIGDNHSGSDAQYLVNLLIYSFSIAEKRLRNNYKELFSIYK